VVTNICQLFRGGVDAGDVGRVAPSVVSVWC